MSDSDNAVLSKWNELKELISELELDVNKNARGIVAAGVRTRKGLRQLRIKTSELVKLTSECDRVHKAAKKAEKTAAKV